MSSIVWLTHSEVKGFIAEMQDRLHALGIAADAIQWEPAYWADLLNDREQHLWDTRGRGHDLDWVAASPLASEKPGYCRQEDAYDNDGITIG